MTTTPLIDRFRTLENEVARASSGNTRLIAVSKRQPLSAIRELYAAGVRDFGENYVQEWDEKALALRDVCPDIRWHFIGRLQKNKLGKLVGRVALIHSLASESDLDKLQALAEARNLTQAVLLQVNIGNDPTKAGFDRTTCDAVLEKAMHYPHLDIRGFMTFPDLADDPETLRPIFRELAEYLADKSKHVPSLRELSMGTTADWPIAVQEGATLIRIGTSIFGVRSSSPSIG